MNGFVHVKEVPWECASALPPILICAIPAVAPLRLQALSPFIFLKIQMAGDSEGKTNLGGRPSKKLQIYNGDLSSPLCSEFQP